MGLAGDGEAEVAGVEDAEEVVDAGVAVAGEGAVEGLASQAGVGSNGGHALGAGDVALDDGQGRGECCLPRAWRLVSSSGPWIPACAGMTGSG